MVKSNLFRVLKINLLILVAVQYSLRAQVEDENANKPKEKTAVKGNSEYNKPTFFEPGEGVLFPTQVFDYDLTEDTGNTLRVGKVLINKKNIFIEVRKAELLHPTLTKLKKEGLSFSFVWPMGLFNQPLIELIAKNGEVLWKKKLTAEDMLEWTKKVNSWKEDSGKKPNDRIFNSFPFNANYILTDDSSFEKVQRRLVQPFRICLSEKVKKASSRFCSSRAIVKNNRLVFSKLESKTRAIIKNEEAVSKNEINVSAGVPFSFYADLKGGESYEFISEPSKLNLVDVVQVDNNNIKVLGFGLKPVEKVTIVNKEESSSFTKFFGFESTIKEEREFWQVILPVDKAYLHFPGTGGGVFKQKINASEIPKSQSRIFLHQKTPNSTYKSNIKLKGLKLPVTQVTSQESSIESGEKDQTQFVWNFKAEKKGDLNKSYLTVNYEGKNYQSFYELYRAYANELSARFTGVVSNSGQVILGEVLYSRWFEAMLGENSFSFQRWGFAGKYFNSLNKMKVSDTSSESLSVMTLDLKYRFTPGVWTRDETSGMMLSYQDITFGTFKAPMLGGGWFWARSMPRIFDNIINFIPFMRYPKWVDMEVIYYFSSMNSKVTLNSPLSVNFHGQILWSKSFFGEAGFGLKRYAFIDKELNQKAELNTFYGTMGLGFKF